MRDAGEHFRLMANAIPQIVWVTDADGRTEFFNRQWSEYTGAAYHPETVAAVAAQFIHPDDQQITIDAFNQARRTGTTFIVEHRIRSGDGSYRWFLVRAEPHRDPSTGHIARWFGSSTDIHDRKQIENELRATQERQAFLLGLSDAIRPLRDPEAVKAVASRMVGERLHVHRAFYAEVDGDDWVIEGRYERGVETMPRGRYPAAAYGSRIMNTYRAGECVAFSDTRSDPDFTPAEREAHLAIHILAAVGVPLIKDGKLIAILTVHAAEPRNWTEDEIELVEHTAQRTWEAVERARAESALRESEEKYRTLFDSIDAGFCIIEVLFDGQGMPRDYRVLEVNPAFEKQTGLAAATGRTMREFVPHHEKDWFEIYGKVARTGQPVRFENHSAGLERFYDLYAFRVGEPGENRVAVLFRDITGQRRATEALERAERDSRTILDSISDGFLAIDREWRFTFLNRAAERILERKAEDLVGAGIWDQYPGLIGTPFESVYRRVMDFGEFAQTVAYFPDHDRFYDVSVYPYAGGISVYFRNVTEQKRAEAALQESEARFRVLTESLPQLVWSCLADGRCDYLSRQWVAYTGVSESEQLDLRWLDRVIHPDDRHRTREHWLGAVAGHHPYDIEFRIRAADGSYRWFQTRGLPVRNANGTIMKWFGTCTDIHDLKNAQEELRKANRQLEEFAYVASHDLQEPLRMVKVYSELLLRRNLAVDDEDARTFARFIREGVSRMETLIRDLLTFSRTIQNHQELEDASADLSVALTDALAVLRSRIEDSGAEITAGPLPSVTGDTQQLALVFQNLLSNALKYRKPHVTPTIRITAEQSGALCIVSIADNGIGFDPKYSERIFGLFKRLHDASYPGTGLGLAICQRVIERYGGRIWAESQPNVGSTFRFALPCARESAERV